MKKIALTVCVYILTLGFSQAQHNQVNVKKRDILVNGQSGAVSSSQSAEKSNYFGYDHKIAEIMIGNTIPANFPIKENNQTKEQYRILINTWIKENPSVVKPEFKSTEITDK